MMFVYVVVDALLNICQSKIRFIGISRRCERACETDTVVASLFKCKPCAVATLQQAQAVIAEAHATVSLPLR